MSPNWREKNDKRAETHGNFSYDKQMKIDYALLTVSSQGRWLTFTQKVKITVCLLTLKNFVCCYRLFFEILNITYENLIYLLFSSFEWAKNSRINFCFLFFFSFPFWLAFPVDNLIAFSYTLEFWSLASLLSTFNSLLRIIILNFFASTWHHYLENYTFNMQMVNQTDKFIL